MRDYRKDRNRQLMRGANGQVVVISDHDEHAGSCDTQTPVEWTLCAAQPGFPEIHIIHDKNCIIGRDPNQVDVTLCHPDISRCHAQLRVNKQGELQVLDLGSLNGTYLGKTRIDSSHWYSIDSGQSVSFGSEDIVYTLRR